jgi:glycosyltransferase involved in cell wall biosynthesis
MKPIVTVGVCLHNCENTLPKAINSILNQDFPHEKMQLIFVDDGSKDHSLKIVEDWISAINIQTKVFKTEWHGLGIARNVILDNADGEYITWVDADEILSPSYIQKQVEFMEKNLDVGITAGAISLVPGNLVLNLELMPYIVTNHVYDRPTSFIWKTRKVPGTGGSTFRTKALRQVNGFDKRFSGAGEDVNVAIRIRNSGWLIKLNDASFYELHNGMSTFADLWKKYYWYGYGCQQLYVVNREAFSLLRMALIPSFFTGLLFSLAAYKLFLKKIVFLLPIHYSFKMASWMLGFMHSQTRNWIK